MPRRRRRIIKLASYLLIACGAFLLFQGARDFIESRLGQRVAKHRFAHPVPRPPAPTPQKPVVPQLGDTVAKLMIPRLETQLYVVEGVDQADLRQGPGHMPGTAMPGNNGNCVIAAHRDTHFRVLKDIQKGDDIVLETHDGEFLYRVTGTRIISPTNTAVIQPVAGRRSLHLITCYPFYFVGHAPKRFLVEAELAASVDLTQTPRS